MRRRALLLACLLIVCSIRPTVVDEALAANEPADAIPEAASLEVLDAGEGERHELRYQFEAGQEETMVMVMDMHMSMVADGQPMETAIPPMRMTMDIGITEITDEGHFRQVFELIDADVDAGPEDRQVMVDMMRQQLAQMKGMSGTAIVTPRGQVREMQVELPEGAPPQVRQQLDQIQQSMEHITMMLPTEPLGHGARWHVVMPVRTGHFDLVQRATYTLRERVGDRVTLDIELEQSAPPQQLGEVMGQPITLRSYRAVGEGEVVMDLRRLVPHSRMTTATQMEQTVGEHVQQIEVKMEIRMQPPPNEGPDEADVLLQEAARTSF